MMLSPSARRLLSLGLLSGSSLVLEIALTRLYSALYYPPYVFAVLSLAVLGLGLGAAAATWRETLRQEQRVPLYLALTSLAALVVVVFTVLATVTSLRPALFVLSTVPYVFIGLALATLFSQDGASSSQLYMVDLTSAGLGAALTIPLLNALGAVNGVLATAVVLGCAALVVQPRRLPVLPTAAAALSGVALVGSLVFNWSSLEGVLRRIEKPISGSLTGVEAHIVRTIWDSFARTDLVQTAEGEPYRIYIDGAAGSVMPLAQDNNFLLRDIGFFPFATAQPKRAFIIGPGGGADVWFGLQSNTAEIVAVEVNSASITLVKDYGTANGGVYDQPTVRVVVDEGRSVLRRENTLYDLVFLSQVVTLTTERAGYTLTENAAYTVEAFQDYLAHLTPDGQIALKLYDEVTLTRALSTALAALRSRGLSDAEAITHVAAFLDARVNPAIPLLIVRNTPYTRDAALVDGTIARDVGFSPLFLPHVLAKAPLDAVQAGTRTFADIIAQSEQDISPTTDDHPFFYNFERGVPAMLMPVLGVLAVVVFAGGALLIYAQRQMSPSVPRQTPLYFAALGIGFMLIEVAIIQQTRLFLGHPSLAVTAVLATLLVGGGVGSWVSGRYLVLTPTRCSAGVVLVLVVWILAWLPLSQSLLTAIPIVRLVFVIVSLLPLALFMGMPFPLGLQAVSRAGNRQIALAWAVNGVTTVAGSAAAVTLAIILGFNSVLFAAIIAYIIAGLVGLNLLRGP